MKDDIASSPEPVHAPGFWHDHGWTARVIKNEDDDGWAVEMTKDGEPEPALVGPWTMGRDKRNPKPLDANAFRTLVKTAYEVRRRHEQHQHALLHKEVTIDPASVSPADHANVGGPIIVTMDIVPDDQEPYAMLRARLAYAPDGPPLGEVQVSSSFKLTSASASAWIQSGYRRP